MAADGGAADTKRRAENRRRREAGCGQPAEKQTTTQRTGNQETTDAKRQTQSSGHRNPAGKKRTIKRRAECGKQTTANGKRQTACFVSNPHSRRISDGRPQMQAAVAARDSGRLKKVESHRQAGHDDRDHRHQFDEDIERRTRRILEGVAHSIAHDGRLVAVGAFTAEMPLFDHLLGVVPRAARIGHERPARSPNSGRRQAVP